jgi:hypothetical protein
LSNIIDFLIYSLLLLEIRNIDLSFLNDLQKKPNHETVNLLKYKMLFLDYSENDQPIKMLKHIPHPIINQ